MEITKTYYGLMEKETKQMMGYYTETWDEERSEVYFSIDNGMWMVEDKKIAEEVLNGEGSYSEGSHFNPRANYVNNLKKNYKVVKIIQITKIIEE